MSEPFIGEIRMFGFADTPVGWIPCTGVELPSNVYTELFLVLKNTYGGDGVSTFRVPDLRGAVPIHTGSGTGLSPRPLGMMAGRESISLGPEMPRHSHTFTVATGVADQRRPSPDVVIGALSGDTTFITSSATGTIATNWGPQAITAVGEGAPHDNCMPTLTLNFCIAGVGRRPVA
ncbi:MAG: tail fiber protein [Alphaproteobacteria bacterium]|nr:tail fiber protein [Alphaproteobacteria bacterium]MBU2379335.1 tail fiber protein [Alphaproteobacteria bacterium]